MIKVVHLLDDFGMGGVTRALTLFDEPALTRCSTSNVLPVDAQALLGPKVDADLFIDHMALSWKRLIFLASLRVRNPGTRIVHVEHSYTRSFEKLNVDAKLRFRAMLKIAATIVDEIICVSKAQQDWMANTVGISTSKLCVIHPWTDRYELFSLPEAPPVAGRPVRLLAYGRYAPEKNFGALIEAMRTISPLAAQLTIFGDGPERAALEASANRLYHVEVLGQSSSPDHHLANCDAVIIPSLNEAFGLVATEARMAGRPILVADTDGLVEQVGSAGLVAPMQSPDEIACAIKLFLKLDLAKLGASGRREVESQSRGIITGWLKVLERAAPVHELLGIASTAPGEA